MRTPDFIIIGAMKCGSTSLEDGLRTHSEIYVAPEPAAYFNTSSYHDDGLEAYLSLFENRDESIVGESSAYAWDPASDKTAKRMGRDVPNTKLLYIIRQPVERVESHWAWGVADGRPWGTINEAVQEADRLVEMSLYWRQLSRYRTHFEAIKSRCSSSKT